MTLSRREQSKRAVEKAAREVAAREQPSRKLSELEIVELIEEHIGWDFDETEKTWAMAAYRDASGA